MYFSPSLIPLLAHVLVVWSVNLRISKAGKCLSPTTSNNNGMVASPKSNLFGNFRTPGSEQLQLLCHGGKTGTSVFLENTLLSFQKKIFRPGCCKTEESFQCQSDAKDFGWVGKFPTRCSEESGHFYFPGNWIKLGYCRKRKYLPNQKSNLIFDKSFPKKKAFLSFNKIKKRKQFLSIWVLTFIEKQRFNLFPFRSCLCIIMSMSTLVLNRVHKSPMAKFVNIGELK